MTEDIVAQLRESEADYQETYCPELARECKEAADEIERLRKALENIVYADGDYNLLQDIARAALAEEE